LKEKTMQVHPRHSSDPHTRSQVITKAFIKAVQLLDLKSNEIVNLTGMSPASWSRLTHHKRLIDSQTKEAELALLFIRIYRSLDALFGGNHSRACEWLHAYNHHLNSIPLERLQSVEGLVAVTTYLDAMRGVV